MQRTRYQVQMHYNGGDSAEFYTNDLDAIVAIATIAASGSQAKYGMSLDVTDLTNKAAVRIYSPTSLYFGQRADEALAALAGCYARPTQPGEGRDVVVEVCFAAHDATLEQCRAFAAYALDDLLQKEQWQRDHGETPQFGGKFSPNGPGIADAWFQ